MSRQGVFLKQIQVLYKLFFLVRLKIVMIRFPTIWSKLSNFPNTIFWLIIINSGS